MHPFKLAYFQSVQPVQNQINKIDQQYERQSVRTELNCRTIVTPLAARRSVGVWTRLRQLTPGFGVHQPGSDGHNISVCASGLVDGVHHARLTQKGTESLEIISGDRVTQLDERKALRFPVASHQLLAEGSAVYDVGP